MIAFKIMFAVVSLIFYGSIPVIFCKMICSEAEKNQKDNETNEDYKNF